MPFIEESDSKKNVAIAAATNYNMSIGTTSYVNAV